MPPGPQDGHKLPYNMKQRVSQSWTVTPTGLAAIGRENPAGKICACCSVFATFWEGRPIGRTPLSDYSVVKFSVLRF